MGDKRSTEKFLKINKIPVVFLITMNKNSYISDKAEKSTGFCVKIPKYP